MTIIVIIRRKLSHIQTSNILCVLQVCATFQLERERNLFLFLPIDTFPDYKLLCGVHVYVFVTIATPGQRAGVGLSV